MQQGYGNEFEWNSTSKTLAIAIQLSEK